MNQTDDPAAARHPLPGPDVVGVGMQLAYWADRIPDLVAVTDGDRRVTFAELNGLANQLVRALRATGAQAGDVVGLMARNCLEWAVITSAIERSGLCCVPINWHLAADEVTYLIRDSGAVFLFHDLESTPIAHEVASRTALRATYCVDQPAPGTPSEFDMLIDGHHGHDIPDASFGTRMSYTSGTTGYPKAVQRTADDQRSRAMELATEGRQPVKVHYEPGVHRHLATGPLYHAGPGFQSLAVPLHSGVPVIMMRKWHNEQFLELVERHRITHAHMAPIMFHRLLQLPESSRRRHDLSSLVQLRHGGAACPVSVKHAMIEWLGPIIDEYYGATEGSATNIDAHEWLTKPGTVGRVDPPGSVIIVDPDGSEQPPGEVGTIYVRAANAHRFQYRGDADKTGRAFRGDHFTVGDVGYIDDDGYLFLTDRSVDLIISGGVNIYPAEIEQVLTEHPGVRDVAVVGVPNQEWGEEVWAAVLPDDPTRDFGALEAELRQLCLDRLAKFKCPGRFLLETDMPREDSGKLFKRRLRERYRSQLGGAS